MQKVLHNWIGLFIFVIDSITHQKQSIMQTSIKHADAILATIAELYAKKGWNSVYAYLKYANIDHKVSLVEFGLDNKGNREEKAAYLNATPVNAFRAHFSNRGVSSIKNGNRISYNVIRAQEIQLL